MPATRGARRRLDSIDEAEPAADEVPGQQVTADAGSEGKQCLQS